MDAKMGMDLELDPGEAVSLPEGIEGEDDALPAADLLAEIVRALVTVPERVRVEEVVEGEASHYWVHVAPQDRGHVIGRKGKTVETLRQLFGILTGRAGRRAYIEVADSKLPKPTAPAALRPWATPRVPRVEG